MIEEEIIKILKRIYKNLKFDDSQGRIAIEEILDLYNKEKEKNKELMKPKYIIDCKTMKVEKLTNDYISKDKIRELPRTEYCNAECLMNGIYVDWDYIKALLEEE